MNGRTPGTADRFAVAFEALNGRAPRIEETKDALRFIGIIEQSGLDPFLLSYIADVKNREQRQALPDEIRTVVDGALAQIRDAIPTDSDLTARLEAVQTFRASMDRAERTLKTTLAQIRAWALPLVAIAGGLIGLVLLCMLIGAFRWGWNNGHELRSNDQACSVLLNAYGIAKRDHHAQTVRDLSDAYNLRCRNGP